jgi:hypothetical protein
MGLLSKLFGGGKDHDSSLALRLASDHKPTFDAALQEALQYAHEGSETGLVAMEEAMRRRSGNNDLAFMPSKLGTLTARFGSEPEDAPEKLITLAKHRALLRDPAKSQDLMSACRFGAIGKYRDLAIRCGEAGGPSELFAFQLLYNHVSGIIKVDRARGKKGFFE